MKRNEAEKVFAFIADIQGELRDKIVAERWWLIWILVGCQMPIVCHITQLLLLQGETREWVFVMVWGINCALIPLIIAFVHRKSGGQRTMIERHIWGIWITFVLCSIATTLANRLLGLEVFQIAPIIALLACFAFAMMGMLVHLVFLGGAFFFFAVMVAMSLFRDVQFLIYGWAWFLVLVAMGVYFRLQKKSEVESL